MNNHLKSDVGKPCPDCKHTIVLVQDPPYPRREYEYSTRCSEFCDTVNNKELQEFRAAKPGDYVVFPCSECGCAMEGEWESENRKQQMCSDCYHVVQLRERTALLEQVKTLLTEAQDEISTSVQLKVGISVHILLKQIAEALNF